MSAHLMLFCTIYTNYNHKLLAGVRKPTILWNKFKGLALKGGPKVSQEEREREDKMLVYIYFKIKRLVLMLIINARICLWDWVGVFVEDKCRYKHNLDSHKIEI